MNGSLNAGFPRTSDFFEKRFIFSLTKPPACDIITSVMKKNDDDIQKKCEAFVSAIQREWPGVKKCFGALYDFICRNHRLPDCAEKNRVSSFMGEIYGQHSDGKAHLIKLIGNGFVELYYCHNMRRIVPRYDLVAIIRVSDGKVKLGGKDLASCMLRDGLDPGAYWELFVKVYDNLLKASKGLKATK